MVCASKYEMIFYSLFLWLKVNFVAADVEISHCWCLDLNLKQIFLADEGHVQLVWKSSCGFVNQSWYSLKHSSSEELERMLGSGRRGRGGRRRGGSGWVEGRIGVGGGWIGVGGGGKGPNRQIRHCELCEWFLIAEFLVILGVSCLVFFSF